MPFVMAGRHRLDGRWFAPAHVHRPTLVFLHEGLGSLGMWRDFPERVAAATGCGAFAYSRYGYGHSDPLAEPRPLDYMHAEALVDLPAVLDAEGIAEPVLIGHSDGATIALLHAGAGNRPVRGLVAMAPHVFVEDITVAGIAAAGVAYKSTDLRQKLARHHDDVDGVFYSWHDTWLNPAFRSWNIESVLPGVRCPVLLIQGEDDEYATMRQLDAIEAGVSGPVQRVELPNCGHTPQRDQPEATLDAIARFAAGL